MLKSYSLKRGHQSHLSERFDSFAAHPSPSDLSEILRFSPSGPARHIDGVRLIPFLSPLHPAAWTQWFPTPDARLSVRASP